MESPEHGVEPLGGIEENLPLAVSALDSALVSLDSLQMNMSLESPADPDEKLSTPHE
jgi:hypothetical protein